MINKIKLIADTLCNYPYEILTIYNPSDFRIVRTLLNKSIIRSQNDFSEYESVFKELEKQYRFYTVCYEAEENRLIINFRDLYNEIGNGFICS